MAIVIQTPESADSSKSGDLEQVLAATLVVAISEQAVQLNAEVKKHRFGHLHTKHVLKRRVHKRKGNARHLTHKTDPQLDRWLHSHKPLDATEKDIWSIELLMAAEAMEGAVKRTIKEFLAEVGAKLTVMDPSVLHIAEIVHRSLPSARARASDATIEKLVEALVETQDPLAAVGAQIDAANAEARVQFMREIPTLTGEQVTTASGSTARNRSQTASRWKAEGKIFSVGWQGHERYPAFQFKDGRPHGTIAKILYELPISMSQWEVAFWFVSTNSWLGDDAPCERLDDIDAVVMAARNLAGAVVG